MVKTNQLADPQGFIGQLEAVANQIVDHKRVLFGAGRYSPGYLTEALERTARRNTKVLEDLSDLRRAILVRVIFLLISIAGHDKKSSLDIDIIYASKEKTAGDQLGAFGGFFKREWREYDYRLGRITAHARLPKILDVPAYPQEAGAEMEYIIPPEWLCFASVTLKDADREPREALRDAVALRIRAIAEGAEVGPSWLQGVTSWAVGELVEHVAKSKLNELLEL